MVTRDQERARALPVTRPATAACGARARRRPRPQRQREERDRRPRAGGRVHPSPRAAPGARGSRASGATTRAAPSRCVSTGSPSSTRGDAGGAGPSRRSLGGALLAREPRSAGASPERCVTGTSASQNQPRGRRRGDRGHGATGDRIRRPRPAATRRSDTRARISATTRSRRRSARSPARRRRRGSVAGHRRRGGDDRGRGNDDDHRHGRRASVSTPDGAARSRVLNGSSTIAPTRTRLAVIARMSIAPQAAIIRWCWSQ